MDTITNKKLDQIANHPLQTSAWANFRKEWGNEVAQTNHGIVIINRLPQVGLGIGTFIRGPMPTKEMLLELQKTAKEKKLIYLKLEPNYVIKKGGIKCADEQKVVHLLRKFGAVPGKTLFTPTSFWIDLTKSEEQLMASFHPKTRYNIRYAQKHGVVVKEDNSVKAFETYIQLMRATVERQGFYAHNERYHRLMWKHLKAAGIAHLLSANQEGKTLTTWIVFKWKDFIYYPYGAWSGEKQNLQPNSLMMWEAIKLGKKLGAKTFDLWGREEGRGFTRFKEGFNPQIVEFLGTWDLVINKSAYKFYRGLEFTRWVSLKIKAKFKKPSF